MSGHVGDLSPQQEEALRKFKAAVADIQNKPEDDDCFHLRWLRARRFDIRKAELMLRNVSISTKHVSPKYIYNYFETLKHMDPSAHGRNI